MKDNSTDPNQQKRLNKIINGYFSNKNRITDRLYFIKTLLSETSIPPMLDFNKIENDNDTIFYQDNIDKESINFTEAITKLGGKLLYVKSGTTGHTFKGIFNPDPNIKSVCINYAVKIVAYPKEKHKNDIHLSDRPENAELKMIKVLSQFVLDNQTPHIVLPIATFNTVITPFINLAKNKIVENKKYDQFVKKYEQGEIHSTVSVLISEWANGGDLLEYIRKNYKKMTLKDWRVIIFQLLSVLAIIHKKYPAFRHNDLKTNNILVQHIDITEKYTFFRYAIDDKNFYVPNTGIQIKITDFDFSCIPDIVDNSKVEAEWTKRINITADENQYYDIFYFFNVISCKGFLPDFWSIKEIPYKVKEFIKTIVPDEISCNANFVTDRGRLMIKNFVYTTPTQIIMEHPFFNKLRLKEDQINTEFVPMGYEKLKKILKKKR
jgi:serine/threonine protein kinase